jgi:MFS family permease
VVNARLALFGLVVCAFAAQLGGNALNVALPQLAVEFGTTSIAAQSVVLVYFAAVMLGLLTVGPLGDRIGRQRVLLAGLAVFGVPSLLGAYASTLPLLVVARGAQGFGAAAMAAMSIALVMDDAASRRTASTLGMLSSASALATMLAPALGGILIEHYGWRSMLLVNIPLVLITAALVTRSAADAPRLGQSMRLFDPALLRNTTLTNGLITSALVAMVMSATLTIGPFVLAREMGLSFAATGLVLGCGPLVSVALAVYAGRLADRIGTRSTTIGALALLVAGAALLAFVADRHNVYAYVCAVTVLSIGYAMFQTPNSAAIMNEAPAERRATVSGLMNLARNFGFIAGTGLLGALFAATDATTSFAAAGALAAVALFIAMARPRTVLSRAF